MAAIALDDAAASEWLVRHQSPEGGWPMGGNNIANDAGLGFAALAAGPGPAREKALDHLLQIPGQALTSTEEVPLDPTRRGWGWTPSTAGWVDPTARALLVLRLLRPSAVEAISDAIGFLADRACVGGGWNYGNRLVLGVELEPYAHPTAVALIALQGSSSTLVDDGLVRLRSLWLEESGGLSLATALAAFRLLSIDDATQTEIRRRLAARVAATRLLGDTVALAWAHIATTDRVEVFRVKR
ncbi:MAG: hypothetical protein AB7O61_00120 [Acidimicrobiia bacterium]